MVWAGSSTSKEKEAELLRKRSRHRFPNAANILKRNVGFVALNVIDVLGAVKHNEAVGIHARFG